MSLSCASLVLETDIQNQCNMYSVPDEENVKAALHIRKSRSTEIHEPDFKASLCV